MKTPPLNPASRTVQKTVEQEVQLKLAIRNEVARNPIITVVQLQNALKNGVSSSTFLNKGRTNNQTMQPLSADQEFQQLLSDPPSVLSFAPRSKDLGWCIFRTISTFLPGQHHDPMLAAMEDGDVEFLEVIGFRGSSKTTWGSFITPTFFSLQKPQEYPFIIIASDTTIQSGANISNIKFELENNDLLKQDYGRYPIGTTDDPIPEPTFESEEEWQA